MMEISDVIWLPQFEVKIEIKHRITRDEVEEIFEGQPRYRFLEKGRIRGENLYLAYGQTEQGRHLLVLFIYKSQGRALVVSARDADNVERKRYGQKK